jgi:hypothetical protein
MLTAWANGIHPAKEAVGEEAKASLAGQPWDTTTATTLRSSTSDWLSTLPTSRVSSKDAWRESERTTRMRSNSFGTFGMTRVSGKRCLRRSRRTARYGRADLQDK